MQNPYQTLEKNEVMALGNSLREIKTQLVKQPSQTGIRRVWYQGEEPYFDIIFELEEEEITWFEFTLRGKSASWDRRKKVWQTGMTNELQMHDVSFYAASKTIETDKLIDVEFLAVVKSILQTRSQEPIFAQVLQLLPVLPAEG
ncbi:hypothetical protein [Calothrix sp. NIES-3974]|uniref:hypothetical protein n=1 Tax=Calothrix sp. NIES-3974 TaxID=2005462 RepID=UPI000B5F3F62|nr:hypothetical protein [Calothrix sp. NIES-3974]BAZ05803.1 hypothetical protein NIES3974_24580 [Calothrix sp. NIES-3974]